MISKSLMAASVVLIGSPAIASRAPDSIPAPAAPPIPAAASASGTAQQPAPALTDADRAQAIQELHDLQSRINALEARLGVPPTAVQVTPPVPHAPRDRNLELYGFAQLDAIQDFKRVDPDWEATLRPSKIPTANGQFGSDGQSLFSVRQSRLGAKASGMVAGKPYEVKFEFDLYGTGADAGKTTFHLRHAYASWGPFLAGQTNTLWMDGDVFPNVLDYWGPPGQVNTRTPQIRFTFLKDMHWMAAVALEHPSNDIDPGNLRLIDEDVAASIQDDEKVPDLTAAVRYTGDWGHVQLAGILRRVGYDTVETTNNEPKGHKTGWGVDASSAIKLSLATLKLSAVYGRGIASFMNDGGTDLAPSVSPIFEPGNIILVPRAEAVKLLGLTGYVDLQWSKAWSSSIGYSFTKVDNTNFQELAAFYKGQYASANVLWSPIPDVLTGAELMWGKREDKDGNTGTDTRLQLSFKWSFSSKNIWDWVE
jgi:hypothetical protein